MTINKDFKKLVRERMEKTGESYTAARAQLGPRPKSRDEGDEDELFEYFIATDGRHAARFRPGVEREGVGYGPSKRWAERDLLSKGFSFSQPENTLMLELRSGATVWTARASENLEVVGTGTDDWRAEEDLRKKLPRVAPHPHPSNPWRPDRFTRTVCFIEHEDGRWSADNTHGMKGFGATRNEAELKLLELVEDEAAKYDSFEDYGNTWDD